MFKGDHSNRECTVYVGNLEKRVTEEILWELFLQAGPLERVSIPKDKETGIQRSFGFVEFSNPVSVSYASELMNGLCLYGQSIAVKPQSNGTPVSNQANRSSPLSFNSELGRHSPLSLFQVRPNNNISPYMGRQNSYGSNSYQEPLWHQHGGYSSPQFGNTPPPSLMQQQYQSRIHHEKKRRY